MGTTYSSGAYQDQKVVRICIKQKTIFINEPVYFIQQTTTDLHDSCTDDHTGTSGMLLSIKFFIFVNVYFCSA